MSHPELEERAIKYARLWNIVLNLQTHRFEKETDDV